MDQIATVVRDYIKSHPGCRQGAVLMHVAKKYPAPAGVAQTPHCIRRTKAVKEIIAKIAENRGTHARSALWLKDRMYYVEVVRFGEPEVVENRIGPLDKGRAETVDSGMQHNLNHDLFWTRIVDA